MIRIEKENKRWVVKYDGNVVEWDEKRDIAFLGAVDLAQDLLDCVDGEGTGEIIYVMNEDGSPDFEFNIT